MNKPRPHRTREFHVCCGFPLPEFYYPLYSAGLRAILRVKFVYSKVMFITREVWSPHRGTLPKEAFVQGRLAPAVQHCQPNNGALSANSIHTERSQSTADGCSDCSVVSAVGPSCVITRTRSRGISTHHKSVGERRTRSPSAVTHN